MCIGGSGGVTFAFFEKSLTVKRVKGESPLLVPVTLAKTFNVPLLICNHSPTYCRGDGGVSH